MRDVVEGRATVEAVLGAGAGGKEAIGDRLRVEIGKVLRGKVTDKSLSVINLL